MTLILLPDLGDLLRLSPQYNAGTVVEILQANQVGQVLWLSSADPDHPLKDAFSAAHIAITQPWQEDWSWAEKDYEQLQDILSQYPQQGMPRLRAAAKAEQTFSAIITQPMTIQRLLSPEIQEAVTAYHTALRNNLDEGPGTRWRQKRLEQQAAALAEQSGWVMVPIDDLYDLKDLLPDAILPAIENFVPSESSRLRALADRAAQISESDDLNALLDALDREKGDTVTSKVELDASIASLYMAVGHLKTAKSFLEKAAHQLTDDLPRSQAGLVLARLGQVRDALGERELAQRAYRAVLALSYAPSIAIKTAEAGLAAPFQLEGIAAE